MTDKGGLPRVPLKMQQPDVSRLYLKNEMEQRGGTSTATLLKGDSRSSSLPALSGKFACNLLDSGAGNYESFDIQFPCKIQEP